MLKAFEASGMKSCPKWYAYNTTIQESSRHTPFQAMFGRQAKLPVDFNVEEDYDPAEKLKHHLCSHDPPDDVVAMNKKAIDDVGLSDSSQSRWMAHHFVDFHCPNSIEGRNWS